MQSKQHMIYMLMEDGGKEAQDDTEEINEE